MSAAIKTQQRGVSVTLKQPHTHTHTHRVTQSHRHWTEVQLRGALLKHLTEQHNMMICCWWVHSYLLAPPAHSLAYSQTHTYAHAQIYKHTWTHCSCTAIRNYSFIIIAPSIHSAPFCPAKPHFHIHIHVLVCISLCVCVCVCVWERERERAIHLWFVRVCSPPSSKSALC